MQTISSLKTLGNAIKSDLVTATTTTRSKIREHRIKRAWKTLERCDATLDETMAHASPEHWNESGPGDECKPEPESNPVVERALVAMAKRCTQINDKVRGT